MTIYFATGNPHKVREVDDALPQDIQLQQVQVDIDEIEAHAVEDVARRKVLDSYHDADVNDTIIVDDTGLYITGLNGFPGAHASYVLERCGNAGILQLMEDIDDRSAYFKTAIAIYQPDRDELSLLTGRCDGRIAREQRGEGGFGYDSIFLPGDHDTTFAEDEDHKMQVSHRTNAIDSFVEWVEQER